MIYVNAGKFLGPVVVREHVRVDASYAISFASLAVPAIFAIYCLSRLTPP